MFAYACSEYSNYITHNTRSYYQTGDVEIFLVQMILKRVQRTDKSKTKRFSIKTKNIKIKIVSGEFTGYRFQIHQPVGERLKHVRSH